MIAATHRRRPQGRDFFDIVFLLGRTRPNYTFLQDRLDITTAKELREHLLAVCERMNFQQLAEDVQLFLFNSGDVQRVLLFAEYIEEAPL